MAINLNRLDAIRDFDEAIVTQLFPRKITLSDASDAERAIQIIAKRNELKQNGRNQFQRSGNLHGYVARRLYRELLSRYT